MKVKIDSIKINLSLFLLLSLILSWKDGNGQLCTNNKDTIYGLTTTGQIVSIDVTNGTGFNIGAPTGTAVNSNAVGFSSITGLFYFFNKNGAAPQQFVSFNPQSGTLTPLAASPIAATHTVRSGCVNNLGSGYYTIDSSHTPSIHSNLIFYNIGLNAWTTLTTVLVDPSNNPIPAIDSLISGDMAIDGNNNLWLLCSSKWNFALYEIKAPLPILPTGPVTVTTIIPITPIPGAAWSKVSFTGVAFNSTGTLYLTLGNSVPTGNKLYKMTSVASGLTLVGPITADWGADLTSCSYPSAVLPVTWIDYTAIFQNNTVVLNWKTNEDPSISEYIVEHSIDNLLWQAVIHIPKNRAGNQIDQNYHYVDNQFDKGVNYYRIIQIDQTGKQSISVIRSVLTEKSKHIIIGPNPTTGLMYFFNKGNSLKYFAQIFDITGKLVYSRVINPDENSIDVSRLEKGPYLIRLNAGNLTASVFHFEKW